MFKNNQVCHSCLFICRCLRTEHTHTVFC